MWLYERRARLSVEDCHLGIILIGGKKLNPTLSHLFLKFLTTPPLLLYDFGSRYADAIEEVASHARHPTCLKSAHGCGLSNTRCANHKQNRGCHHKDPLFFQRRCLTTRISGRITRYASGTVYLHALVRRFG